MLLLSWHWQRQWTPRHSQRSTQPLLGGCRDRIHVVWSSALYLFPVLRVHTGATSVKSLEGCLQLFFRDVVLHLPGHKRKELLEVDLPCGIPIYVSNDIQQLLFSGICSWSQQM